MTGSKLTRGGTIAVSGQDAQGRMSGINELSVDQMAVLGLVLRQGRPFAELAGMLDMDEGEMRRRAHEALDALGPDDGAGLPGDRRARIGDYLLGQQSQEEQAGTRRFLEESPPGRAWARVVADQLGEVATDPLPPIPAGPGATEAAAPAAAAPVGAAAATAPVAPVPSEAAAAPPDPDGGDAAAAFGAAPAADRGPRSSRLGGALLLGGIALVAIAVALFFALRGGGGDDGGSAGSTPAASTTATQPQAQVVAQANLVPPKNRKSLKALGVVLVQKAQGQDQIVAAVQGLPKPKSGGYGIWLHSRPGKAQWLGFFASQDQQGRLLARGQLKTSIAGYREVLVTREAKGNPKRPGAVFLRGPLQTPSSANGG